MNISTLIMNIGVNYRVVASEATGSIIMEGLNIFTGARFAKNIATATTITGTERNNLEPERGREGPGIVN